MGKPKRQSTPTTKHFADTLSELIADKRDYYGLSASKIAENLGVSKSTLSEWTSDISTPSWDNLIKISDYFGVSIDCLLGEAKVPSKSPDIRMICEYTGLDERSINKLRELSTCENGRKVITAFIDNFLSQRTLSRFEKMMELAIMAHIAYDNTDTQNGGPVDFEELRMMNDDEREKFFESVKDSMDEHGESISNGEKIRLDFDEAAYFYTDRAGAFLHGVVDTCILNLVEQEDK